MIRSLFEIILLSFTIFAESSGEPYEGKVAVGSVIRNRAEVYQESYSDIILANKQFSCYNSKKELMKHIKRIEIEVFAECAVIALGIYYNIIKDNTEGALYYVKMNVVVKWMKKMRVTILYNNHKFMVEN